MKTDGARIGDSAPAAVGGPGSSRVRIGLLAFFSVTVVLAAGSTISGVVQRVSNGWQPQGDDAAIAWLTHDVFTSHTPLVGMPSTIGGHDVNVAHHWGPLLFWVLSIPQTFASDSPTGLQLGLLVFSLASIAGIAIFTHRRLGRLGTVTMLSLLALVTWALGRQIFSSIWNPDIAILPLVFVFVLVWSIADGDYLALPFLAFAASFVVQCNLLYTPLVAVLLVWAAIGLRATKSERRRGLRLRGAHLRRILIAAGVVLVTCWSAPIVQELSNRPGNVEQVLSNGTGEAGPHVGALRSAWILVRAIGLIPFWSHPISSLSTFSLASRPSVLTLATAVGIVLLIGVGFVWSWREQPDLRSLLGTAVFGLLGVVLVVARLPWTFGVALYRLRSVWIVGMFLWFALVVLIARVVAAHWAKTDSRAPGRLRRVAAVFAALVLVSGAVLGASGNTPKVLRSEDSSEVVRRLVRMAGHRLQKTGPYLAVENSPGVGTGVLWGLERRGFDIRLTKTSAPFDAPYLSSDHGPEHQKFRRLYVVDETMQPPLQGKRLLGRATDRGATQRVLVNEREKSCRLLKAHRPRVTVKGRQALLTQSSSADLSVSDYAVLKHYASGASPCGLIESIPGPLVRDGFITVTGTALTALLNLHLAKADPGSHKFALYVGPP